MASSVTRSLTNPDAQDENAGLVQDEVMQRLLEIQKIVLENDLECLMYPVADAVYAYQRRILGDGACDYKSE